MYTDAGSDGCISRILFLHQSLCSFLYLVSDTTTFNDVASVNALLETKLGILNWIPNYDSHCA